MSDKPFSERMGFVPPKPVQTDDLDKEARTHLYNAFLLYRAGIDYNENLTIWTSFFGNRMDQFTVNNNYVFIEGIFCNDKWHKIFEFIEFLYSINIKYRTKNGRNRKLNPAITISINKALELGNVGYKFVDGKFIPIQTQEEQETIESVLQTPYENARNHIKKSIIHFSARTNPDYANSIKESICAIESIYQELTGETKFADAVNKLNIPMHKAFKESIKNLYGFTSDEEGIRHAATGEPLQINQATARYMLNVCSAMVNYITANTDKK